MRRMLFLALLMAMVACTAGCAASTSKLDIDSNSAYKQQTLQEKKDIPSAFIRNVTDGRVFSDGTGNPADPTPDIKSKEQRNITIGRKRGGFGNAWGSIVLKNEITVTGIIRSALEKSLTDSGFMVIHDETAIDNNTFIINCCITKFWNWMNLNFASLDLNTDIAARIQTSSSSEILIEVSEQLNVALATDSNIKKSIHNAMTKFGIAATEKFRELEHKSTR